MNGIGGAMSWVVSANISGAPASTIGDLPVDTLGAAISIAAGNAATEATYLRKGTAVIGASATIQIDLSTGGTPQIEGMDVPAKIYGIVLRAGAANGGTLTVDPASVDGFTALTGATGAHVLAAGDVLCRSWKGGISLATLYSLDVANSDAAAGATLEIITLVGTGS